MSPLVLLALGGGAAWYFSTKNKETKIPDAIVKKDVQLNPDLKQQIKDKLPIKNKIMNAAGSMINNFVQNPPGKRPPPRFKTPEQLEAWNQQNKLSQTSQAITKDGEGRVVFPKPIRKMGTSSVTVQNGKTVYHAKAQLTPEMKAKIAARAAGIFNQDTEVIEGLGFIENLIYKDRRSKRW